MAITDTDLKFNTRQNQNNWPDQHEMMLQNIQAFNEHKRMLEGWNPTFCTRDNTAPYPNQPMPTQGTWGYQAPMTDAYQMELMRREWEAKVQSDINSALVTSGFNGQFPQQPTFIKREEKMALNEQDQKAILDNVNRFNYRDTIDRSKNKIKEPEITHEMWQKTKEQMAIAARSLFVVYKAPDPRYNLPEGNYNEKEYSFTKETTFINNSDKVLYMLESNNTIIVLAPVVHKFERQALGADHDSFIIRDTYVFSNIQSAIRTCKLLEKRYGDPADEIFSHESSQLRNKIAIEIAERRRNRNLDGKIYVNLDRIYLMNEQYERERVYIQSHNVIITHDEKLIYIPHPHTMEKISIEYGEKIVPGDFITKKDSDTYHISINLIDNDNEVSDRYTYLFGKVIKLTPKKDPTKENGLYMHQYIKGAKANIAETYYDVNNLEKANLFSTKDKAIYHGNHEVQLKDMDLRGKQVDVEKKELEKEKLGVDYEQKIELAKLEKETIELKAAADRQKREDEAKAESQKRHDENEAAAQKAKDDLAKQKLSLIESSIKLAIGVAAAVVAGIALYNKFEKSSGSVNSDGLSCISL